MKCRIGWRTANIAVTITQLHDESAMVGQRRLSIANHRAASLLLQGQPGHDFPIEDAENQLIFGLRTKLGMVVVIFCVTEFALSTFTGLQAGAHSDQLIEFTQGNRQ